MKGCMMNAIWQTMMSWSMGFWPFVQGHLILLIGGALLFRAVGTYELEKGKVK